MRILLLLSLLLIISRLLDVFVALLFMAMSIRQHVNCSKNLPWNAEVRDIWRDSLGGL